MENKVYEMIASINILLDIYSCGGTEKIDFADYKYIQGMLEALMIMTDKKYVIRNYRVVDIRSLG